MAVEPRNFKLLAEYDSAIGKEQKSLISGRHENMINYGLANQDDLYLNEWEGMIIGIQGKQTGEIMYGFHVTVPPDYPLKPPSVRFTAPKLKMDCVDARGNVDVNRINANFRWTPDKNIASVLMALRDNMYTDKFNKESFPLANTSY